MQNHQTIIQISKFTIVMEKETVITPMSALLSNDYARSPADSESCFRNISSVSKSGLCTTACHSRGLGTN